LTPEAADYLAKAHGDLSDARKIAAIGLAVAAARSAYYAAFHAAEAYIVENTGRIAKSHSGVRSEFGRLAKEGPALDRTYSTFLAKAYSYKEIGDYRVDQGATVSDAEAGEAIEMATRFVEGVTALLAGRPTP
jgi:uncharacterized protein (UPF0332 family)